jgi:hypothetical protein
MICVSRWTMSFCHSIATMKIMLLNQILPMDVKRQVTFEVGVQITSYDYSMMGMGGWLSRIFTTMDIASIVSRMHSSFFAELKNGI